MMTSVFLFFIIGLLTGIATLISPISAFAEIHLHVSEATTLHEIGPDNSQNATQTLNPNSSNTIELKYPVELVSETRIPVILVPVSKSSDITIDSPKKKEVIQKIEEEELSTLLSNVMGSLADIQNQIRKQQLDQALHALVALEAKYPDVKFLEFTRASILLLQGHREEAKRIAQAALIAVPNYQEGQRFIQSLGEKR